MKASTKKVLWVLVVVIVLVIGAVALFLAQIAPIGSAYMAKRLCSCVFVSHRDPASIMREDLGGQGILGAAVSTEIDSAEQTVTGTFLGMAKRIVVYREGLGCTMAVGMTEDQLKQQAAGFTPPVRSQKTVPWPDCDLVPDALLPTAVDANKLKEAMDWAFSEPDPNKHRRTRAVVIVYDGRIIAERYAPGITQDTALLGWSMTKSVTNALVGILVKEGKLSLKAPAPVPEWQPPGDPRSGITLDQLMRMSSGLKFQEEYTVNPRADVPRMLFAEFDTAAYAANKPLAVPPDSRWEYSSGTTNIISRIVRQTVGGTDSNYFAFPHRVLFDKIGIFSAVIEPDPSGTFVGSSFMYATARDWARFGLFCLQDGVWNSERILPEGWMAYSTTPTPKAPQGEYGAQFWLNAGKAGNPKDRWMPKVPTDMYTLSGFEEQYVTMVPSKKLVIIRLGLSLPDNAWDQEQFIANIIAVVSSGNTS